MEKFYTKTQKIIIIYYQKKEMSIFWTYNKRTWGTTIADGRKHKMVEEDRGDREQCGRITSRNEQKYHIMTASEWHKIENDGDP